MDSIYTDLILEHYKKPKNKKKFRNKECSLTKEDFNPLCGDRINICLKIKKNKIEKIFFDGDGCVISQASASIISEKLIGKKIEQVLKIDREKLLEILGLENLTIGRLKCAMLPLLAIKKGIIEYEAKKPNP